MHSSWWVQPADLDEDQKQIITLPIDGSFLVTGPPGSGKTNLLLLRANYAAQAGHPNLLVLTIARTLREFLASGSQRYAFPSDKVKTTALWSYEFLRENGASAPAALDDYNENRAALIEALEAAVDQRGLEDVYEMVLLDEAQDYWPQELDLLRRLAKRLFAVGDRHQKIYKGGDSLEHLKNLVDESRSLQFHYRNGQTICQLADTIAKTDPNYAPLAPTCHYDEASRPSSVDHFEHPTLEHQVQAAIARITVQLQTYPGELIGIVCPRNSDTDAVWSLLQKSAIADQAIRQSSSEGYIAFDDSHPVWVSSLHGAKGLEYRALHVLCAEGLKKFGLNRNMAYTAVTRAKTSLSLYHSGTLPGYLEQGLVELSPPGDLPTIDDAFGASS